jgi:hypothetical protein
MQVISEKKSSCLHVLNHHRWFDFSNGSQTWEWKNFIKENTAIEKQKEVVYFSLVIKMVKRVAFGLQVTPRALGSLKAWLK